MSVLDDAWQSAQPKLSAASKLVLHDVASKIARVGQLDAELLDHELIQVLQEPLFKALSLIRTSLKVKYEHEIRLFVQLVLYKLSVWNTGASYGSKLQDLRYVTSPVKGPTTPSGLPRQKLLLHGLLTILAPYLHSRIRLYALSRAWPEAPSSDSRGKAWTVITAIESAHGLLGLLNFIAFLWNGSHRTLADRILGMRLVPSRRLVKRDVSYEFMNRQMVWHAFTEFLIFTLPLVNTRLIRRHFFRILSSSGTFIKSYIPGSKSNPSHERQTTIKRKKFWTLSRDQCAICAENASFSVNLSGSGNTFSSLATLSQQPSPILHDSETKPPTFPLNIPYLASCGDIYCYYCISERIIRAAEDGESNWECLRCGEQITGAERLPLDVEGNETSDYDLSDEELESTSLSGSMGSYVYSESDNGLHS